MKSREQLQIALDEIRAVCHRHDVVLIGSCESEGIAGEIFIADGADVTIQDCSLMESVQCPGEFYVAVLGSKA